MTRRSTLPAHADGWPEPKHAVNAIRSTFHMVLYGGDEEVAVALKEMARSAMMGLAVHRGQSAAVEALDEIMAELARR